jgi:glycosyltransferase involved in cell wall biosynthesis
MVTPQWSATMGGPSKYVAALAHEQRALGHTVSVITTDAGLGATVIGGRTPLRDWRLFQALRQVRPDIVHLHGRAHMVPAALLYRAIHPAARIVFTFHTQPSVGSYLPGLQQDRPSHSRARSIIAAELLRRCDVVTTVSRSIITNLNALHSLKIQNFETIPSGGYPTAVDPIDLAKFRMSNNLDRHFPVLSSVGVFSWDWKVAGHLMCIDAVSLLVGRYPQILLLIAGDGQYRMYLEDHVRSRGVERYIRFLGNVSNSAEVLAATDIYLHLAMNEGCSLALIEAMLAERPIIAARRGGNPEVVEDDVSARLIEPEPSALASAILELLGDSKKRTALATRARARALRSFAWSNVVRQYEVLYAKALSSC